MGLGFEDDRFAEFDDADYQGALARYESEPTVRVLFENGAGNEQPGAPQARFEASYASWPPPDAQARTWYLDAAGSLSPAAGEEGADRYRFDANAGGTTFFGSRGYELTAPLWDIAWSEFAEGDLLSYVSPAFTADTVLAGPGFASLWIESQVDDASVQVTLTEVRQDGTEYLVQSGWLRLGHRRESESSRFEIERTYDVDDFEPFPVGDYVNVRVAIPSVAHAFRAGSSLRVMISAPGRNHGTWEFESPAYSTTPTFAVGRGGLQASFVMMPTVTGVPVAAEPPPCPGLRGQPCRTYRAVANSPR